MARQAVIIGCGYTGRRVASLLIARGWHVTATTRSPRDLRDLRHRGAAVVAFDVTDNPPAPVSVQGASVLLSIPTLRTAGGLDEPTPRLVAAFDGVPHHVTYLSTTGVYGAARLVDATTAPAPETERQHLRVLAEEAVAALPCPSLVLRPAAIYGPGRGVHAAMRNGRFRLSDNGDRYVSRIHVEDLSRVVSGAMDRQLEGSFPVADELPASSRDVACLCSQLLGLDMPAIVADTELTETRRADRRVDGTAVLQSLGLRLRYRTYREGVPACLAEERDS